MVGGGGNDLLIAGGGTNDRLYGEDGNDDLRGSAGGIAERFYGGDGDDVIRPDDGDDVMTGGRGNDTFVMYTDRGDKRILDFNKHGGRDVLDVSHLFWNYSDLLQSMTLVGKNTVISTVDIRGVELKVTLVDYNYFHHRIEDHFIVG